MGGGGPTAAVSMACWDAGNTGVIAPRRTPGRRWVSGLFSLLVSTRWTVSRDGMTQSEYDQPLPIVATLAPAASAPTTASTSSLSDVGIFVGTMFRVTLRCQFLKVDEVHAMAKMSDGRCTPKRKVS